jgi:hypothetical protein
MWIPDVIPQGLKPHIFPAFFGPAKAVPLLQSSVRIEGIRGPAKAVPLLQNRLLKHALVRSPAGPQCHGNPWL